MYAGHCPLGKSPVIDDDGLVLSESGASTAYLARNTDRPAFHRAIERAVE